MKLVIRGLGVWGHPNIRTWEPEDPSSITQIVMLDIGDRSKQSADSFTLRIATPAALDKLEDREGIVATRPLLVLRRYDYDQLWTWLERTVASCEADSWSACVEKLRRYFGWEYDDYQEV